MIEYDRSILVTATWMHQSFHHPPTLVKKQYIENTFISY